MSTNTFPEMKKYFEAIVVELRSKAQQAILLKNTTAVGTKREEIYRQLLVRHLPSPCKVFRGGYVFNVKGERSKQTDVIVTAGSTPRFEIFPDQPEIAPLEGTIAVAEVKSRLDKERLLEALNNFASLPRIDNSDRALAPKIKVVPRRNRCTLSGTGS